MFDSYRYIADALIKPDSRSDKVCCGLGPHHLASSINMARSRHQRQPILLTCVRSVLWFLIVVSFMAFFFALFIRPTAWYSQNTGGHFGKLQTGLTLPWHVLANQIKNVTAPVFAGTNMAMVRASCPGNARSQCL